MIFIIKREDEADFPHFKALEDARTYFRNHYDELYSKVYSDELTMKQFVVLIK